MCKCNGCCQCKRAEARDAENVERELQNKRIQASNLCIEIYNDFDQHEILTMPKSVQLAWSVGCQITNLIFK